ncbi:MAG: phage integrase N-terminal SAM-like domain-containing protein [Eisenbergiella massiliensis]
MTRKEQVVNDVLIAMRVHLTAQVMTILQDVLIQAMHGVEVVEEQTALATQDVTNDYIIELFNAKKAPKTVERTAEQYLRHINLLIDVIHKPLTQISENDVEYFLMKYRKKGNINRTVNNCKRFISAFFT